jgi:hypothetical protein
VRSATPVSANVYLSAVQGRQEFRDSFRRERARLCTLVLAGERLGSWLSAALDDPNVCVEMKTAINTWFAAFEKASK